MRADELSPSERRFNDGDMGLRLLQQAAACLYHMCLGNWSATMEVSFQLKCMSDTESVHQWIMQRVAPTDEMIAEWQVAAQASLDEVARQEAEARRLESSLMARQKAEMEKHRAAKQAEHDALNPASEDEPIEVEEEEEDLGLELSEVELIEAMAKRAEMAAADEGDQKALDISRKEIKKLQEKMKADGLASLQKKKEAKEAKEQQAEKERLAAEARAKLEEEQRQEALAQQEDAEWVQGTLKKVHTKDEAAAEAAATREAAAKEAARDTRDSVQVEYDMINTDGDGKLTRAEWKAKHGDDSAFDEYDINHDGVVDQDEFRAMRAADYELEALQKLCADQKITRAEW